MAMAIKLKGMSRKYVCLNTGIGRISAVIPIITKMLIILLPNTLETARSVFPLTLAKTLIMSSGKEVPMATIVRPVMPAGMPNFVPIDDAPSINMLAPPMRITKPRINNKYSTLKVLSFGF